MADGQIDWVPAKGLNLQDPLIRVRPDQAAEGLNFVFEDGVARMRPPLHEDTYTYWPDPSGATFTFGKGVWWNEDNPYSVGIKSNDTFVQGPTGSNLTQSGGGTVGLASVETHNIAIVNGVFLIGNNALNGVLRHDPTTTDYTVMTTAPWRYVTGLYSRAIGAHGGSAGGHLYRRAVGWSIAGDETNWTGTGSGQTVLTETPDEITGLRTIENIVVIPRGAGITLGYATGSGTAPIRFENLVRAAGAGCPYPSSLDDYNNNMFWVGQDDVYHMDKSFQPNRIGREVRREVLRHAARGVLFRGIATRMDYGMPSGGALFAGGNQEVSEPDPRLRYHLIPIQNAAVPHYSFDFESGTWGRHVYSSDFIGAWEGFQRSTPAGMGTTMNLALLPNESSRSQYRWAYNASGIGAPRERPATLRSGVFVVGSPGDEYTCQRLLLVWALAGLHGSTQSDQRPSASVKVTARQQSRPTSAEVTVDLYALAEGSEDWQATWVDLKVTGNFFQIHLEFPPELRVQVAQVSLPCTYANVSKAAGYKQS